MFRTVLVHIDNVKDSAARCRYAIALAREYGSTLIGMTAGLPRIPIEVYDAAIGSAVLDRDYDVFDRDHLTVEFSKAEAAFKKACEHSGLETEWRSTFEDPSTAVASGAVAADVVVIGAGSHTVFGDVGSTSAADVVLRAGRPVLVVPESREVFSTENIVVAWKDSPEAQRAVSDALPFMKRAMGTKVVVFRDGDDGLRGLDDVMGFLWRHGVAATSQIIPPTGEGVEQQLLDFARDAKADLIVAGAYGHSRLREWVFGGVTRELLLRAPVPCLLSR